MSDRQVGRLRPFEDSGNIDPDLAICVGKVGAIAQQTTSYDKFPQTESGRDGMARSQSRELIAMGDVEWISGDDKCVGALLHKACEDGIEFDIAACTQYVNLQAELAGHILDLPY